MMTKTLYVIEDQTAKRKSDRFYGIEFNEFVRIDFCSLYTAKSDARERVRVLVADKVRTKEQLLIRRVEMTLYEEEN